jgi:hypothetical protein
LWSSSCYSDFVLRPDIILRPLLAGNLNPTSLQTK